MTRSAPFALPTLAVALGLLAASPAAAQTAPGNAPAGARAVAPAGALAAEAVQGTLTGAGLRARLVNATVSGSEGGLAYEQYLAPDGILRGRDRRGTFAGTWTIRDDVICLVTERARGCYGAALSGGRVTWFRNGVLDGRATLRPGNPDRL